MTLRESTILAPDGRPVLIAGEPSYRASGRGRRFTWLNAPTSLGPNAALLPDLDMLRARSRALYRNNAMIWGAIETLVSNLVGWGLTPKSMHENETIRTQVDNVWLDWSRQIKLDALQKRAARECMLAGEVFIRIRNRLPTDTDTLGRPLIVPLELQLIEAEHCPTWEDRVLPGGRYVRGGIEFDAIGRRRAYWMFPEHPGDSITFSRRAINSLVPVPASEVLHLFDPDSPEAIRGVPRLSRVIMTASDLEAFNDATLQRAAISSLFAGFIRKIEGPTDPGLLGETAATPEPILEPGTLSYLGDGEDITFPSLPDVGANYAPFVKAMHQIIARGVGLTAEQVSGDLSQVNYSSIRAGSLEFRRACQQWQYTTYIPEFLEPLWVRFLRRAALVGAIDMPDLATNELAAGRVEFLAQGWDWVDPEKEVNAAMKSIGAGFETRRSINIARGNDPRRLETERADELARAKELDVQYTTDVPEPKAETAAPAAAAETAAPPFGRKEAR